MDFMARQDPHIQDHFLFLWEYARDFEERKPKHLQSHHLQREMVTVLIRLRLAQTKAAQQELQLSLGETVEPDEVRTLSRRFQELLAERRKLEQASMNYSQAARWANNHRSQYNSLR